MSPGTKLPLTVTNPVTDPEAFIWLTVKVFIKDVMYVANTLSQSNAADPKLNVSVAWGTILPLTFKIWPLLLIPVIETLLAKEATDKVPIVAVPVTDKSPLALIFPLAVIWPFKSIRGAVTSNVVPEFISKWPSADAIIFSPPAASWNDNLLSPDNTNSSADSSHSKNC